MLFQAGILKKIYLSGMHTCMHIRCLCDWTNWITFYRNKHEHILFVHFKHEKTYSLVFGFSFMEKQIVQIEKRGRTKEYDVYMFIFSHSWWIGFYVYTKKPSFLCYFIYSIDKYAVWYFLSKLRFHHQTIPFRKLRKRPVYAVKLHKMPGNTIH